MHANLHAPHHQALSYMKRSSSVTVLNGNIHQTMRKVEGNVQFSHGVADCCSAARAWHAGASPCPIAVPVDQLRSVHGIKDVNVVRGQYESHR